MKKYLVLFLAFFTLLFSVACDTADIEVGVSENGLTYFHNSTIVPKMTLGGEEDKEIEDKAFFGYLIEAIEDKTVVATECDCQSTYTVAIKQYRFAMHSHGIIVTRYDEGIFNYKHKIYVCEVACDAQTMDRLFSILESIE